MPDEPMPGKPTTSESASGSALGAEETMPLVGGLPAGLVPRMQQLQAQVNDMAHLMRLMVHRGPKGDPSVERARDYLRRHGLQGSILRTDENSF